jgi:NAD(P)-dependent dehydrogenase (short-subunit alcohol dehydrogenase family)
MHVVLADVEAQALARAEEEIAALGAQTLARVTDVAQGAQVQALADATLARFGAPTLLFNNAGVSSGGLVWENTEADWQWVCGVNLMGVANGLRSFTPMMLDAARQDPAWHGHIVNTASMAGWQAAPTVGLYNATKFAVVGLTETLFHDLALVTEQVHASVLCPALVPTGIVHSERNRQGGAAPPLSASQKVGRSLVEMGMAQSRVTARAVAQQVLDAVGQNQFYIFTHPEQMGPVHTRFDDVRQGRAPTDPFGHLPMVSAHLRSQLWQGHS